jgi:hypothetical protein
MESLRFFSRLRKVCFSVPRQMSIKLVWYLSRCFKKNSTFKPKTHSNLACLLNPFLKFVFLLTRIHTFTHTHAFGTHSTMPILSLQLLSRGGVQTHELAQAPRSFFKHHARSSIHDSYFREEA